MHIKLCFACHMSHNHLSRASALHLHASPQCTSFTTLLCKATKHLRQMASPEHGMATHDHLNTTYSLKQKRSARLYTMYDSGEHVIVAPLLPFWPFQEQRPSLSPAANSKHYSRALLCQQQLRAAGCRQLHTLSV